MAKLILVVKYTFFVIVVLSAGLVIERLQGIKRWWEADSLTTDDLFYNASSPLTNLKLNSVLSKHYLKCVTQPSKPFCLLTASRRLEIFRSDRPESPNVEEIESRLQNITSDFKPLILRIRPLLVSFTRIMKANHVKVLLIEPSVLFCLLSSAKKFDMLAKGFNPGRLKGSRNIVTVGVLGEDSGKMETDSFTNETLSAGFKMIKFRKWIVNGPEKSFETVHYFFVLQGVAVHVVVFYARETYLWHAGLDPKEIDFEGLLFVNDGMFESYKFLPLNLSSASIDQVHLPHDIQYFMKEMDFSASVECRSNSSASVAVSVTHPSLNRDQMYRRVSIVLMELKSMLIPQSAHFWLWSKSLQGWFEECDIFRYSTTLDLALQFKSIEHFNFTEVLDENEFLNVSRANTSANDIIYEVDCRGLLVNIFILGYKQSKEHERFTHLVFPLCSTALVGQKILVPCNAEDVVKLEREQNVSNLNDSIKDNITLSYEAES